MKKMFVALVLVMVLALSFGIVACGKKKEPIIPPPEPPLTEGGGLYFPIPKMNGDKKLIVLGGDLEVGNEDRLKLIVSSAIQGLSNQDTVKAYLNYKLEKDGSFPNQYFLDDMAENYGVTTEIKSFAESIEYYKSIAKDNAGFITYSIDYDNLVGTDDTRSLTAAINMCAIRGWIPVEKSLKVTAQTEWGLTEKLDVSDKDDKWVFENYKTEFDNSILIQQRPMENKEYKLPMVSLRDYGIANKFFTFYDDGQGQGTANYRKEVHAWGKQNKPILGWGPGDEGEHISYATEAGQFPIPSDFSFNLSVTSADIFQKEELKQKNQFTPITPQEGKHYVAFGRSDGDNITTWQTEFIHSLTDFGSPNRGAKEFSMGWSISPALAEIFPSLMRNVYKNSNEYDYFIAPVSGQAYMYPTVFPEKYKADYFSKFDKFLKKSDLKSVSILDHGQAVILKKDIANYYASASNLIGGFCFNGNKYKGGNGAVVWSDNGKPFIAPKESLWTENTGEVVARIGQYRRDYKRIEGYSFVNLHPWTHTYQDVEYVVEQLKKNPNIVIVSPDQLLDMISKNVKKEDVTAPENVDPELPYVVPSDPLHNRFLPGAETEDWAKVDGSIKRVNKSVGGALGQINGLQINGTGEKTYTLPNEENLVISFDYIRQGSEAEIKAELEINGVTKVVLDGLKISSADGVSNIVVPISNFFSKAQYGLKEAKFRMKTTNINSASNGVVITNVITRSEMTTDPTSGGNKLLDDIFKDTQDWYTNTFAKNARIVPDNDRLMMDGSDGWTGFYDDNINTSMYKTFTIPQDMNVANIAATIVSSNTGTKVNALVIVDGKVIELSRGFELIENSAVKVYEAVVNNMGGKNATVVIMQRDSKIKSGIGEACYLSKFSVSAPTIDPYYNKFTASLEDWTTGAVNVIAQDGWAKFTNTSSMYKTITMPTIESFWSQVITFDYKLADSSNTVKLKLSANVGDKTFDLKEIYADSANSAVFKWTEIEMKDVADWTALSGKEVAFKIECVKLAGEGDGILLLDEFKVLKEKNVDPYNNTFTSNLEDWVLESKAGWVDGNGIVWGNDRMEVSLNGFGTVNPVFEAVGKKAYTLPENTDVTISFDVSTPAGYNGVGQGGSITMTLEIDGIEYVVMAKTDVQGEPTAAKSVKLNVDLEQVEELSGITYAGKDVILRLKFNDEGFAGGVGVNLYIDNFVTAKTVAA